MLKFSYTGLFFNSTTTTTKDYDYDYNDYDYKHSTTGWIRRERRRRSDGKELRTAGEGKKGHKRRNMVLSFVP